MFNFNSDIIILLFNAGLYFIVLAWQWKKFNKLCLATFISLYYFVSATAAIYIHLFLDQDFYAVVSIFPMRIMPFLYLWTMYLLMYSPLLHTHVNNISKIELPTSQLIPILIYIIFACHIIYIVLTPLDFSLNQMELAKLSDNYTNSINEVASGTISPKAGGIYRFAAIFKNALYDMIIVLLIYCLVARQYMLAGGLTLCLLYQIITSLAAGLRSGLLEIILGFFFIYLVFKDALSHQAKKTFHIVCTTVLIVALGAFFAITIARFSEFDTSILDSVLTYFSESFLIFNSHGIDPGGCRYADFTFPIIRRLVGLEYSADMFENMDKYSHLGSNCSVFNSVVGDFTMDFGVLLSTFIFIISAIWLNKQIHSSANLTYLPFHQIILLLIVWRISTFGLIAFSYWGIGRNVRLITDILLYFVFRYAYKTQISNTEQ